MIPEIEVKVLPGLLHFSLLWNFLQNFSVPVTFDSLGVIPRFIFPYLTVETSLMPYQGVQSMDHYRNCYGTHRTSEYLKIAPQEGHNT